MGKVFISLVVIFIVLGGLLIYQGTQSTSALVLLPSELITQHAGKDMPRVRIGGRVIDPIDYQLEPNLELTFSVTDPKDPNGSVPVVYRGVKPDMFAAGRDVLIDGDYVGGTIQAAKLLTQCPSKYEPPAPGASKSARGER